MRFVKSVFIFLFMAASLTANASVVQNAYVTNVVVAKANTMGGNRVCVYLSEQIEGGPACATTNNRYCADLDGPIGHGVLSVALAAQASGKLVKIAGDDTCLSSSNSEDIAHILIRE